MTVPSTFSFIFNFEALYENEYCVRALSISGTLQCAESLPGAQECLHILGVVAPRSSRFGQEVLPILCGLVIRRQLLEYLSTLRRSSSLTLSAQQLSVVKEVRPFHLYSDGIGVTGAHKPTHT